MIIHPTKGRVIYQSSLLMGAGKGEGVLQVINNLYLPDIDKIIIVYIADVTKKILSVIFYN
jgi:hypothetical protein